MGTAAYRQRECLYLLLIRHTGGDALYLHQPAELSRFYAAQKDTKKTPFALVNH